MMDALLVQSPDFASRLGEQPAVMGDHEQCSLEVLQGLAQGFAAFEIQVVRGFVQEQHVAAFQEERGQHETALFAT